MRGGLFFCQNICEYGIGCVFRCLEVFFFEKYREEVDKRGKYIVY